MASTKLGTVKSGKTRQTCTVTWDAASRDVYVSYSGGNKHAGKASSAADAMRVAEAFAFDK